MEIANRSTAIKRGRHAISAISQSCRIAAFRALDHRLDRCVGVFAGAIALSLAALIYFADRDPVAVSFVLVAFAAIIGVVLRESVQKREQG